MADNSALAQKIRELLKKKEEKHDELKKIEQILQKEDEEIRKQLEETVREIREEEEEKFKEEHSDKEEPNLERTVEEEHPEPAPKSDSQFAYTSVDSQMLQSGDVDIYDIATQGVYDRVTDILNTPEQFRTSEERNFLKGVTYHVDRIQRKDMYVTEKDPNDFLKRTQNVISNFYK